MSWEVGGVEFEDRTAQKKMNYAYLVRCSDNSLYAGWTNDVEKRLKAHNAGTGAKYTKYRRPVTLAYLEAFETKSEAMKKEAALKKLTRRQKEKLVVEWKQKENP